LTDNTDIQPQIVYTLNSQDTVFALTKKREEVVCGHTLILTEHPKLLIFETTPNNKVFDKQYKSENLDIFIYMNSKFVYVEKHIHSATNMFGHESHLSQWRHLQTCILKVEHFPIICQSFIHFG